MAVYAADMIHLDALLSYDLFTICSSYCPLFIYTSRKKEAVFGSAITTKAKELSLLVSQDLQSTIYKLS